MIFETDADSEGGPWDPEMCELDDSNLGKCSALCKEKNSVW